MASTIEGGCLCGGVRYRLQVWPKQGSDCHCEDCRRASAAPYVTWCSVPSKAIETLSGELRRVSYADRLRSFASCCGTPLFMQDEVSSTAGHAWVSFRLRKHIYCDHGQGGLRSGTIVVESGLPLPGELIAQKLREFNTYFSAPQDA